MLSSGEIRFARHPLVNDMQDEVIHAPLAVAGTARRAHGVDDGLPKNVPLAPERVDATRERKETHDRCRSA